MMFFFLKIHPIIYKKGYLTPNRNSMEYWWNQGVIIGLGFWNLAARI
jgi:hypothetical protein